MLTPAQLVVLKAAILAETNPAFVGYRTNGQNNQMAAFFNEPSSPAFTAWRTALPLSEIYNNGFDWVQVDNVIDSKWRTWQALFDNPERRCNPSKANVRAGIAEVWSGSAPKVAVQAAVLAHCKRTVSRVERLFATGTGSIASPGDMVFEGLISDVDIQSAVFLP